MPSNLLALAPQDPFFAPDVLALVDTLRREGFLGDELPEMGFYKPGEAFFQFITFLGCSPVVSLGEPGKTAEICRIEISAPSARPVFFAGNNVKLPRCPECGARLPDTAALGAAWQSAPETHRSSCHQCGNEYGAHQLQWRHCAGFGRFFLKVWGVFEGEAVPSERLMETISAYGPFVYFYVQK